MNIETERKYLIELSDPTVLADIEGCRVLAIRQTYLKRHSYAPKTERRVRSIVEGGAEVYVYTEKSPRAYLSRYEDEREITREEYERLLSEGELWLSKVRYAFPYMGHVMEIDVYPPEIGGTLLEGRAILEVELETADEAIEFPPYLHIVREVTDEKAYHNRTLAHRGG